MIIGIGVDVVSPERLDQLLEEDDGGFEARVFTPGERDACRDRADRVAALAARFAAKEACFKALGRGLGQGMAFHLVSVSEQESGQPRLELSGAAAELAAALGVTQLHVSLTHDAGCVAAIVVLEGPDGATPAGARARSRETRRRSRSPKTSR